MLECYKCDREPNIRECGRCRLVLKYDLVKRVLEMDPVYLSEANRNKRGRPSKIKDTSLRYKVAKLYKEGKSYREIGKICEISKDSARKIVKEYGRLIDDVK